MAVASLLAGAVLVGTAACQEPQGRLADVEPSDAGLAAWRQHLEPSGRELRWESVPWLPTFGEGLLQADREAKPLLLWVMNGHPLGCT